MEKTLLLEAKLRDDKGTKSAAKLRGQGRIPAVVYGHKQEPVSISLNLHDVTEGLHHGHRVVDIKLDKKKETVMFKDIQYDHLGKNIIHADLIRVDAAETIHVNVPIELKGTAIGTHNSGIIEEHVDKLQIECKVTDIPETIVVSVADVDVGDNLHAGDIELPAGIKLVSDPNTLLVTCQLVAAAKTTEQLEEEVPIAPEVIGEEKPEGEGEADEAKAKE